jgi:hypothetical protein
MAIATRLTIIAVAATMAVSVFAPLSAMADDLQNQKNNMRNAAIGAGVVTLYGLKNGQHTTALLGAAGTAYALSEYERKRHEQSVRNSQRAHWHRHHRYHHHYHH